MTASKPRETSRKKQLSGKKRSAPATKSAPRKTRTPTTYGRCPHCGLQMRQSLLRKHEPACGRPRPVPPKPPVDPQPPEGEGDETAQIQRLLAQSSWLSGRQRELLTSFLEQLTTGRRAVLSEKQRAILEKTVQTVDRLQEPHFFRG